MKSHDKVVFACALLAGLPAVAVALILIWTGSLDGIGRWLLSLLVVGSWLAFSAMARQRVVRPLQTMSNLLLALREGDYSFRARGARHDDPLGEALSEINTLGSLLQSQRRGAVEATALLRTVMEEIDVGVFAFDSEGVLRLVNRAGQRLLGQPPERLVGRSAQAIGLAECLEGDPIRMVAPEVLPGNARWGLRRTTFRDEGRRQQLVVIADLSRPLREEELKAWQGVVRVLGHELNNSLAPIKSIAGSLRSAMRRSEKPEDWESDLGSGLDIIASRAEGLERFLQSYSSLARLPAPTLAPAVVADLVGRAAALEKRLQVGVVSGPAATVLCDSTQVEQVLINLVKNAVEAVRDQRAADRHGTGSTGEGVRIGWNGTGAFIEIRIEDDGPGLAPTANLFVPFFTTKPAGSGIGLVLSRKIAENHGGSLELRNRSDAPGCVAIFRLPAS